MRSADDSSNSVPPRTKTRSHFEVKRTRIQTTKTKKQIEKTYPTPDDDREDRLDFVRTLAQQPDAGSVNGLSILLSQDEDPLIRRIAAIGLGKTPGDTALAALNAAIQDEDSSVKRRAIQGLGKKKDDRAVHALREVLLGDPDPQMRRAAVRSLGMMHTEEAFNALLSAEYDPDYYVRRETVLTLDRIKEHGIEQED